MLKNRGLKAAAKFSGHFPGSPGSVLGLSVGIFTTGPPPVARQPCVTVRGQKRQAEGVMLIKSADDKSRRLALLQDLQQSPLLEGDILFLPDRGYALKLINAPFRYLEPNRFHPVHLKSSIL
jgi:hypothetical protein